MNPFLSLALVLRYSNHQGDSLRARQRSHLSGAFYSAIEDAEEREDADIVT